MTSGPLSEVSKSLHNSNPTSTTESIAYTSRAEQYQRSDTARGPRVSSPLPQRHSCSRQLSVVHIPLSCHLVAIKMSSLRVVDPDLLDCTGICSLLRLTEIPLRFCHFDIHMVAFPTSILAFPPSSETVVIIVANGETPFGSITVSHVASHTRHNTLLLWSVSGCAASRGLSSYCFGRTVLGWSPR